MEWSLSFAKTKNDLRDRANQARSETLVRFRMPTDRVAER